MKALTKLTSKAFPQGGEDDNEDDESSPSFNLHQSSNFGREIQRDEGDFQREKGEGFPSPSPCVSVWVCVRLAEEEEEEALISFLIKQASKVNTLFTIHTIHLNFQLKL